MDSATKRKITVFANKYNDAFLNGRFGHVEKVRKYSLLLAKKEKANQDVVEIAAFLHDIGLVIDQKNHEQESARIAKQFLEKIKFPEKEKKMIIECILKHRSSKKTKTKLLEAKIVAAADSIALLVDRRLQRLFYKVNMNDKKKTIDKIRRMYEKIKLESAKRMAKPYFEKSMNYWKREFRQE